MWVLERILNMNKQPYKDKSVNEWKDITQSLIDEHPLNARYSIPSFVSSHQVLINFIIFSSNLPLKCEFNGLFHIHE